MKFAEIPLLKFGHSIHNTGSIYTDEERDCDYLVKFPGEELRGVCVVEIDPEEWQQLLLQTDRMETEILAKAKDGAIVKAMFRKCNRQIEQNVSWEVFRRDGYACRYCGNNKTPLTVDHLVTFETGGPSIPANLVSSCKRDNKARGNMEYAEWLNSSDYRKFSSGLSPGQKQANLDLIPTLASIPRKYHVVSR